MKELSESLKELVSDQSRMWNTALGLEQFMLSF